jgi:hypothetical protein
MLNVVHYQAEPNEASGSVLDEIVREAARQMLAVALQAEVLISTSRDTPILSPIALPARRRRARRLRNTRIRSR